jgi:hypothetical protein
MKKYLTVRELWLMQKTWNEAVYQKGLTNSPQLVDWLEETVEPNLKVRQALAKAAPKENQDD